MSSDAISAAKPTGSDSKKPGETPSKAPAVSQDEAEEAAANGLCA